MSKTTGLRQFLSSPYFRGGVGFLLSGIALFFALRNVNYDVVWQTLHTTNLWFVLLALLSVAINTFGKAIRWNILLKSIETKQVSFLNVSAILLVGQMLNNLIPLRAGDIGRVYMIGKMGIARVFALGTVVLEKLLDMISYALLFFVLLILIPLPNWISDPALSFSIVVVVLVVGVVVLVYQRDRFLKLLVPLIRILPDHLQESTKTRVQSGLSSLEVLENRSDRLWLIGWSALIWATAVLNNYLTLMALDIHLTAPVVASILVVVVLQIGISLPTAPGTIGVFQYSCVLALGLFGIEQSTAFSYGILLHVIVMVPTTLIGIVLFWTMGFSKKSMTEKESE